MDRLLNITTGLSILLLVLVLGSLRRAHIRVEYSVSWLAAGLALLVLSRNKWFLETMTRAMGLLDAPVGLLMIAGAVFLLMFFRFSVIISHLRDDNIALAQRVAILEYRIRGLQSGDGN
jgi:hypothetical protein